MTALSLPSRDGHSRASREAAEPILREEALQAQSASIDLLSGRHVHEPGLSRVAPVGTGRRRVNRPYGAGHGTVVSFHLADGEGATRALDHAVAWLHEVDARFSPFRSDSEVMRLADGHLADIDAHADVREVRAWSNRPPRTATVR